MKKVKEGFQKELGRHKKILEEFINFVYENRRQSLIQSRKSTLQKKRNSETEEIQMQQLEDYKDFIP